MNSRKASVVKMSLASSDNQKSPEERLVYVMVDENDHD